LALVRQRSQKRSPLSIRCWNSLPGGGSLPGLPPGRWAGLTRSWWFTRPEHRRTDRPRTAVKCWFQPAFTVALDRAATTPGPL